MYYSSFMNRSQIKQALLNCAKTHGMSLSEFAAEADVSPSTLTGFVNDISTRADHVLSMRTIGKLTKRFPDLSSFLQLAEPAQELQEVRFIGLVDTSRKWQVVALDPNSPGSTMIQNQNNDYVAIGVKSVHQILNNRVYFCKPDINENINELAKYVTKLVVVDADEGKYLGYLMIDNKDQFYIATVPDFDNGKHEKLIDLTNINWFMPVEWIRP